MQRSIRLWRRWLALFATATMLIIVVAPLFTVRQSTQAVTDKSYIGINNGTGYNTDPAYVDQSINHDKTLGVGSVRMGMDNVNGNVVGAPFNWGARDVAVDKYRAADIEIRTVVAMRGHVSAGANYDEWKRNWDYFVRGVMNHYKGKIFYYIIDNETDLSYGGGQHDILPVDRAIEFTRIAYVAAREIDPAIRIESPPTTSPETDYLRQMIEQGVTNYADYLGVHIYGGQIDDGRMQRVWEWMGQYNVPKRPVSASESGFCPCWAPAHYTPEQKQEVRRRWFARYAMQLKRYGYSHSLLFDLDGHDDWAIVNTPAYDELKNWFRRDPFANGGFEGANDREHQWVVYWGDDAQPIPNHATFITNDAASARSGSGYLNMNTGATTGSIMVRRVAEQLTPGREYTIGAWVNIGGGGTARLRALGFDHLDGDKEVVASTSNTNGWQYLSLKVRPTKTWVVIDLSTTGTGASGNRMRWDDVSIGVNGGGSTIYEAEASGNVLADGAQRTPAQNPWKVNWMGSVTINNVNVATTRTYTLTIAYTNGASQARTLAISVNGGATQTVSATPSGGWDTVKTLTTSVTLNAGNSSIKLSGGSGGGPDIDKVTVSS